MALLVNFIGFQVGWFACVLGAANDKELLGMIIALGVIIYHVATQGGSRKEIKLVLVAVAIGLLWETWVLNLDILRYPSHPDALFWAPTWLIMMWALFATTINLSMGWLKGRWVLSVFMGAVFGPLAFIGGERLGAVVFLDSTISIITLSAGWGLLMPLLLWIAERINQNFNSQENAR
jgi:hypothetical protein